MVAPFKIFGPEMIEQGAITQLINTCELPIAARGALMPDGHQGYCLPIGGVFAANDAVIPYAVGVDIGCRMRLSIVEMPQTYLNDLQFRNTADNFSILDESLVKGTRFGLACEYTRSGRQKHPIMDDGRWRNTDFLHEQKGNAWKQLGTSGSGNHFVEWGTVTLVEQIGNAKPGRYLGLMSHSGSRGTGHKVCMKYTKIARKEHPDLGERAYLDFNSSAGQEYWEAMNLMLDYAEANHDVIHDNVLRRAGLEAAVVVQNHHNFASIENGLVVHRKGATPAQAGVLGVVPGSLATHGYIVKGLGEPSSLESCSHGAGRCMPRGEAKRTLTREQFDDQLAEYGVRVLAAGVDEMPAVYKSIDKVIDLQVDAGLIELVGRFEPRIVLMAAGGRAED